MLRTYLDFEKPVAEIEAKIEELQALAEASGADAISQGVELSRLKTKAEAQLAAIYAKLDPWQKAQVARHQDRPHFRDYVAALVTDFLELSGDRNYGEDAAILGGTGKFLGRACVVLGHEKGRTTSDRLRHNFGMARPEGYRKAVRLMDLADRFQLPVITFVDTAGAYPGIGAEERGQGEAIARSTERCLTLGVPMVSVITGEGGSGGAIAIAAANKVLMLEHSIYAVISPEGAASILYKKKEGDEPKADRVKEVANSMRITAQDLLELGVIDQIVAEPMGGAHREPAAAIASVGAAIASALDAFAEFDQNQIRHQRRDRFLAIGRFEEEVSVSA
ncbi:acetyl-CoA carboxylase carboxyltransferase subunit alpha [Terricaulis silvestris]|uniref:Acetyl-coenzyme A carboxylase carboxyl transferase subunit alpha n=1 Tax=Terricaulis silvestris TaxID=2686094 RepID=A0A6I6MLV9_9CAUL|nr:acetyl-CoA carboxylase carboxyltransferase subunit alpha [Terricaulis silvestris]QGZ93964.1 Acetyl-coenzyme A carboxylase carboxyl transferase subunit alpha [Terricaulis silvestris]